MNCHWLTDIHEKSLVYNQVKSNSLARLAEDINHLGKQKIIAIGDFNIEPSWRFRDEFIQQAGTIDIVPNDFVTILPTLFRFPMPDGGRTDYIFTKNISTEDVLDVELIWNRPIEDVGQLSDHAGIMAEIKC